MNIEARVAATILAIVALSIVGCGTGTGSPVPPAQGGPSGLPAGGPPGGSGSHASTCVVGAWRSDGYAVDTANATATGGGGFAMTIGADGQSVVDFARMQPVTIKVTIGGSSIDSHVIYTGRVAGKLKLPPPGASTGQWESEPGVNWGTARITLDVNGSKIMDSVSLADAAKQLGSAGAAAGTSSQPVLGAGTYTCTGTKLSIDQRTSAMSATWTLHREG